MTADVIHGDCLDVLRTLAPGSVDAIVRPLCIDLFCGLGGWTEGFLAEGWDVIGFDIERHVYGEHRYPAQLVLQDVRTIHGSQFRAADMIVASSPCQEFSYRAMPWKRAKALGPPVLGMELFAQAARIQREACEAAGRHIPMIQENVCGAQPWVGRAQWHYGSYYLWGDVPALMPMMAGRRVMKEGVAHRANGETNFHASAARVVDGQKNPGFRFDGSGRFFQSEATKNTGGSWFYGNAATGGNPARGVAVGEPGQKVTDQNPVHAMAQDADGVKGFTPHGEPMGKNVLGRRHGSKSKARKAASARIAKIPAPLARHIAWVYVAIARRRIAEAQAQGSLFGGVP